MTDIPKSEIAYFTYSYGDLNKDPLDQTIDMHRCLQDAKKYAERWQRKGGVTVHIYEGVRLPQ